jgi:pyridoxamine 5'-phosphate oxidase
LFVPRTGVLGLPRYDVLLAIALAIQGWMLWSGRETLDERMSLLEDQYPEGDHIPRPEKWGAFRVVPDRFEFWAGRSKRFHDRIVFSRDETATGWVMTRLQP